MTEKDPSVSDFELIQNNDFIKLEKDFNELKNNYVLLEEKNNSFENKMNIEFQKIKSDHSNEIEEIKQNFQKLFNEMLIKLNEEKFKIEILKVGSQSGMKILKEEMNKMITSLEKKNSELTVELDKLNKLVNNKQVSFVYVANKWKGIGDGFCIEGNGFINLIDDQTIKYNKGKVDKEAVIYSQNSFNKPKEYSINYSLFYFEVKCKIEGDNNKIVIGLETFNNICIRYNSAEAKIKNGPNEEFRLPTFSFNNGDIFGCGLVYPPTRINELPYIFFTQNGKQIGKAVLAKDNCDSYKPYVILKCCSAETNFGNDLKVKPFIYAISKNSVLKNF
ncbi:hypothetical protein ACQ4LE_008620 [Meloidogyne hapla]